MKTIVAVASQNFKTIFNHVGKCKKKLINATENNDIASKQKLSLTKEETLHDFFQNENHQLGNILLESVIMLTRGIGNGAIQKLAKFNIICYKIEETNPDIVLEN